MHLPRVFESHSLRITISVTFALLLLLTTAFLGTTALILTRETIWDTTTYYTNQLVERVRDSIATYLREMDDVSSTLLADEALLALERTPDSVEARDEVRRVFATVTRLRPDVSLISLVGPSVDLLIHDGDATPNEAVDPVAQEWYRGAVTAAGAAYISGARVQNLLADNYRWVVSVSRARGELVLLVDLTFRLIEQLARRVQLGPRGYLFITDSAGAIIYHPQQQLIYSDLVTEPIDRLLSADDGSVIITTDGERRLYTQRVVAQTGWRVIAVSAVDQLLANQRRLQAIYLSFVLVSVGIVMALTVFFSRRIALPVMRLRQSMQAVEQGRFDIDPTLERRDEIGALSRDFRIMLATIQELLARSEREQEEKRRSEIMALQAQITPHFLYNTLDSIVWMAEGGQTDEVVEMTTNLARLLRLSIGGDEAMVTLRSELDYLHSYLTIQRMRYRDRLAFEIDADAAVLGCRLPRLTLQPLVENAIYHGIKNRAEGGTVRVACRALDDSVEIAIADDGPGIAAATLTALREHRVEPRGGVGLQNVQRRLVLTFGEEAALLFESEPERGTVVRVRVPMEERQ